MKGGVGKTTLACNLALGLAKFHNKKILLVDLDPQFNATQYFVRTREYLRHMNDQNKCSVKDIFIDRPNESVGLAASAKQVIKKIEPNKNNCIISLWSRDNSCLDLIPSSLDLMEADKLGRGDEHKLGRFLRKMDRNYDFVIIDCPPTISLFTMSAFIASDAYLVPIKPDWMSSIGLSLIDRAIKNLSNTFGKRIEYLGLLFIMVRNNKLMKDTIQGLRKQPSVKCFNSILSDSIQIAGTGQSKSIFDLDSKKYRYVDEMRNITRELLNRIER